MKAPVKVYNNADCLKAQILAENRGKVGVYRWVNNITGKYYIGSSANLTKRFYRYFSVKSLEAVIAAQVSLICRALLKYGYAAFTLEILEYCELDQLIEREQYYLDSLNPPYNILPTAGSSLGYRHTEEAKAKISAAGKGVPKWAGLRHSEETKAKLSALRIGKVPSNATKVSVLDLQGNLVQSFTSITACGNWLGVNYKTVANYILNGKVFHNIYYIRKS